MRVSVRSIHVPPQARLHALRLRLRRGAVRFDAVRFDAVRFAAVRLVVFRAAVPAFRFFALFVRVTWSGNLADPVSRFHSS